LRTRSSFAVGLRAAAVDAEVDAALEAGHAVKPCVCVDDLNLDGVGGVQPVLLVLRLQQWFCGVQGCEREMTG
jgi:hypothetical protein